MALRKKTSRATPESPGDAGAGVASPPHGPSAATPFPIVGIGASAGGLAAIEAFFAGMPADTDIGMAFVLVQHLDPDHKSLLTELIQRRTRMQVFEVTDGMRVQADCAYIIPPNRDMAFLNGTLQLLEPAAPRGHRLPIDFLFSSLAADQHERAIAIVLSGTGSDGTLGVRSIKAEGGMVMVQTPASSEFDGMPQSALATGLVDYTLLPADMAAQLVTYVAQAFGRPPNPASGHTLASENALKKIFVLLRSQTGHDFSQYKPSTINRRIERRMAVHQIASIDGYVKYLQQTPEEVQALFNDVLIGVTHFFRDTEAFAALEAQVIPKLFQGKPAGAAVRVWCTGCSTGEEAYSIAILLQEQLQRLKVGFKIQVFATDIDSRAVATARLGVYPASIAEHVSPERLARFFTAEADGSVYRIHKSIRDLLVFSEQDVIKDPPFSRLDLITCRNLLIYLGADLQKKLIALFHYALHRGGFLFLGTSETAGEQGDLFTVLERKAKIYQRKEIFQGHQRIANGRFLPPLTEMEPDSQADAVVPAARLSLRELTEQTLLQQLAPVGALVNANGDVLYLHGRAGLYLEPAPGEAGVNNILAMARVGLRPDLMVALHRAASSHELIAVDAIRVKTNGHHTLVNLRVCPVPAGQSAVLESPLFVVMLDRTPVTTAASVPPTPKPPRTAPSGGGVAADDTVAELKKELLAKEEYLRTANDVLETTNEELKSSNEEMQSVNEELQSSNEELETSKEEMQSINEELSTVNSELQTKVADLSRANNDMNNLLAGTGIGTIFVDLDLRILRFTPAASAIINLIPSDCGRPVGHIVSNLVDYNSLVTDVQAVLRTLSTKEVDVRTTEGKAYTLRILPYRTLDNVIEGAVITFVETTEIKHAHEALRKANALLRLAVVVRDAHDAITVQELDGRIIAWNPAAEQLYGWTEAQALHMNVRERIPAALQPKALAQVQQLSQAETLAPYETERLTRDGRSLRVALTATALLNESGQVYAIATTERLVTP